MANQQAVSPFGILEHVPMDIDRVRTFVDFEVIDIVDDSFPYLALLGIDWGFNNLTFVDLKNRRMTFEGDGLRFIAPLDPDEVRRYTEPIREQNCTYDLENIYKLIEGQHDYINPTIDGNLSWQSENACSSDSEEALENWQNIMYEVSTRRCATLTKVVHWIGKEVSNLPTFDGLNNLETFLAEFERIVPIQQRLLALDEVLKQRQLDGGKLTRRTSRNGCNVSPCWKCDFQTKIKVLKFDTRVRVSLRIMCEVVRNPGVALVKNSGYISSLTP
jgi:hypothetical protein